jgi:hypothetical protein
MTSTRKKYVRHNEIVLNKNDLLFGLIHLGLIPNKLNRLLELVKLLQNLLIPRYLLALTNGRHTRSMLTSSSLTT